VVLIPERDLSFRKALRQIVPVLYLCLIFDIFAGFFLGSNFEKFIEQYPALLIVLPGLMGLRGNVFGAMASRLSTAFYLGSSEPDFRDRYVVANSLFSVWLATVPALILLFVAFLKYRDLSTMSAVAQIAMSSSVVSGVILSVCTAAVVIMAFKRAIDPDSISGPFITSVADLITIPSLVFFLLIASIQGSWILAILMCLILLFSFSYSLKDKKNWTIYRESAAIVFLLSMIQIVTGNVLEEFSELVYLSVFIGFAYPAIIDQLGNYGSIVVARTSTSLHLGEIEKPYLKRALRDMKFIMLTVPFVFPFISFIPILIAYLYLGFVSVNPLSMALFFFSFVLVVFLVLLLSFYIAILLQRLKVDPDNGGIPLVTTISDVLGTVYAVFVAWIFITF